VRQIKHFFLTLPQVCNKTAPPRFRFDDFVFDMIFIKEFFQVMCRGSFAAGRIHGLDFIRSERISSTAGMLVLTVGFLFIFLSFCQFLSGFIGFCKASGCFNIAPCHRFLRTAVRPYIQFPGHETMFLQFQWSHRTSLSCASRRPKSKSLCGSFLYLAARFSGCISSPTGSDSGRSSLSPVPAARKTVPARPARRHLPLQFFVDLLHIVLKLTFAFFKQSSQC